jgi:Coenzyme PQQ synthesis protein D (PqqD)
MSDLPATTGNFELATVQDGFVVYDPERDRVHFFNHTAALVLEFCDGTKSDKEIAALLQRCYELSDPPEAEVADCLAQLRGEGLIR